RDVAVIGLNWDSHSRCRKSHSLVRVVDLIKLREVTVVGIGWEARPRGWERCPLPSFQNIEERNVSVVRICGLSRSGGRKGRCLIIGNPMENRNVAMSCVYKGANSRCWVVGAVSMVIVIKDGNKLVIGVGWMARS
ncbi:hypothetical protein HWI79_1218, partial [Cryptosporidium felis]